MKISQPSEGLGEVLFFLFQVVNSERECKFQRMRTLKLTHFSGHYRHYREKIGCLCLHKKIG